jgi:hypothetical protein
VRGRTILVLYGDHGDADVDLTTIGDVISFAPLVASSLERLIVQRKRGRAEGVDLGALLPKQTKRTSLPSPEVRAQALASVLSSKRRSTAPPESEPPAAGTPPSSTPATASEPPAPATASEPPAAAAAPSAPPVASSAPPVASSAPPVASSAPPVASSAPPAALSSPPFAFSSPPAALTSSQPASQAHGRPLAPTLGAPATSSSNPPRSIAEALARPVIPVGRASSDRPTDPAGVGPIVGRRIASIPPQVVDRGWEELSGGGSPFMRSERGTRPGVGSNPAPTRATPKPAEPRLDESPDVSVGAESADEADLAELAAQASWLETDSPGVPLASTRRSAAHSARPLPAPRHGSSEQELPTVIVDVAQDCKALLEQLLQGDVSAGDRLVAAGSPGIAVLVGAFPGPIESPSSRRANAGMARASDLGPVLRTLARIGEKAVPFLVVRTNDAAAEVRGYATRLLGEIPSPESAHAIARRFFDGDVEVRRAALTAARLLASSPDAIATLVAELGVTSEDRMRPTSVRLTAMESLAELRQPQAVPYLTLTLEDNPVDIIQSARRALVILARQDFGTEAGRWNEWWRTASTRHRIEWLIDSLTHESTEIRRAAGEELKALTREYFGYYDDLPAAERAAAQRQYRQWWDTRGKARFRAP